MSDQTCAEQFLWYPLGLRQNPSRPTVTQYTLFWAVEINYFPRKKRKLNKRDRELGLTDLES